MIIRIQKFVIKSYGDLFKERTKKLIGDLLFLIIVIAVMFWIESFTKDLSIRLFEVSYRLDILLFYVLGFIFILTSSVIFLEIRRCLNLISTFVISRFPRMKGDFGPAKMIFRDLVQIVLLILIFYPISTLIENISFRSFQPVYLLSLAFLILTLLFVYNIIYNIINILSISLVRVMKIFSQKKESL